MHRLSPVAPASMLSKPAIGLAVVAVGASVYVKYYGFPDLQQQPASVQAELERAASMRTGEPMVLILGTHRVVGNPLGQLLVKVAVWKASTYLPHCCCCACAAGYLLFFITAGAFMFESGQAVVCAIRRYRWKPAGTPQQSAPMSLQRFSAPAAPHHLHHHL